MTAIKNCKPCIKNSYQDEKYDGKRVANETMKGYRCTVCGKDIEKLVVAKAATIAKK